MRLISLFSCLIGTICFASERNLTEMEQSGMQSNGIDRIRAVTLRDGRDFREHEKQRLALPNPRTKVAEPSKIRVLTLAEYGELLDAVRRAVNGDSPRDET